MQSSRIRCRRATTSASTAVARSRCEQERVHVDRRRSPDARPRARERPRRARLRRTSPAWAMPASATSSRALARSIGPRTTRDAAERLDRRRRRARPRGSGRSPRRASCRRTPPGRRGSCRGDEARPPTCSVAATACLGVARRRARRRLRGLVRGAVDLDDDASAPSSDERRGRLGGVAARRTRGEPDAVALRAARPTRAPDSAPGR